MTPDQIRDTIEYIKQQRVPAELLAVYRHLVAIEKQLLSGPARKLSDEQKAQVCHLHSYYGMGYKKLAKKFEVSIRYIRDVLKPPESEGVR